VNVSILMNFQLSSPSALIQGLFRQRFSTSPTNEHFTIQGKPWKERLNSLTSAASDRRALTEFALIAPVILLLTFGIIDFGPRLYLYITLQAGGQRGRARCGPASYFSRPERRPHHLPGRPTLRRRQRHALGTPA
jgi:hypothetical protein